MYVPTRAKYEFEGLTETIKRFVVDVQQEENESLVECTERFKQCRDIFESTMGPNMLDEFMSHTQAYQDEADNAKKALIVKNGFKQWSTFVYLKHADQRKYGKLLSNLKEQYALGNDQYPKTLDKGTDALNNHIWDPSYKKDINNKKKQQKEQRA